MKRSALAGQAAALLTILIWGTTFISTKLLLEHLRPVEILFLRFAMGFLALLAVCPRRLKGVTLRQEGTFAAAGVCGICLYYLLENVALTYTMASNVGVILSAAPLFTGLLSRLLCPSEERLGAGFFAGFALAMAGIGLISFGGAGPELNPVGDGLALLAALLWAVYSLLTRRISGFGYPVLLTTRRTFFYGLLFMLPALWLLNARPEAVTFMSGRDLWNLLYLGLGASALCFVTWNVAVKRLGAVGTSVYIYMVPVITLVTSALILKEPITWSSAAGTALTVGGLLLSEFGGKQRGVNPSGQKEGA